MQASKGKDERLKTALNYKPTGRRVSESLKRRKYEILGPEKSLRYLSLEDGEKGEIKEITFQAICSYMTYLTTL
jgi:hypothetical protein